MSTLILPDEIPVLEYIERVLIENRRRGKTAEIELPDRKELAKSIVNREGVFEVEDVITYTEE